MWSRMSTLKMGFFLPLKISANRKSNFQNHYSLCSPPYRSNRWSNMSCDLTWRKVIVVPTSIQKWIPKIKVMQFDGNISNNKYFDFCTNWTNSPLIVTVTKIFAISKNLSESKVVIIKVIWECEMSIITILASLRILRMFQLIQWNNQENKIPVFLRLHFKLSKAPTFEKLLNNLVQVRARLLKNVFKWCQMF